MGSRFNSPFVQLYCLLELQYDGCTYFSRLYRNSLPPWRGEEGRCSVLLVRIFKYWSHVKLLQLEGVVKTKFTLQLYLKINTEGHGMGHFYKVFFSLAKLNCKINHEATYIPEKIILTWRISRVFTFRSKIDTFSVLGEYAKIYQHLLMNTASPEIEEKILFYLSLKYSLCVFFYYAK
jgi:hypothetical protein